MNGLKSTNNNQALHVLEFYNVSSFSSHVLTYYVCDWDWTNHSGKKLCTVFNGILVKS